MPIKRKEGKNWESIRQLLMCRMKLQEEQNVLSVIGRNSSMQHPRNKGVYPGNKQKLVITLELHTNAEIPWQWFNPFSWDMLCWCLKPVSSWVPQRFMFFSVTRGGAVGRIKQSTQRWKCGSRSPSCSFSGGFTCCVFNNENQTKTRTQHLKCLENTEPGLDESTLCSLIRWMEVCTLLCLSAPC